MEPFFSFLGGYWWLVFPLMGVMGGIGSAWERGARRRHKRRLEVLHAKAEITAAKAGVRPPPSRRPTCRRSRRRLRPRHPHRRERKLERLFASHDAVTARWLEYELDVAKLIAFPR